MENVVFKKKFKPLKPVIGSVLILFGLFMLSTLFQDVIRIKAVLVGAAGIALGVFLLIKPFDWACARCNKFLSELSTHIGDADSDSIIAALKAKDLARVRSILSTSDIPAAAEVGDTRLVLSFEYCEQCNSVARVRLSNTTYGTNPGDTKETELVAWQEYSDATIAEIVREGGKRNEQQTAEKYKHLTP